ncbi:MAG: thymidine kinase [Bacteroidetes bacterium]|nr:thymidine kinase [Bacteroidota bacterium]
MFIEPKHGYGTDKGWIEVICGSMFSGKTEELIRRVRRAQFAKQIIEIYKPAIDNRYHEQDVVSHDENALAAQAVESSVNILLLYGGAQVVAIDEAQFFDLELTRICDELASRGVRVIVAGLDMDFKGEPFGPMPALMAKAEYVTKVHAICSICGDVALYSYRLQAHPSQILLGEKESYEPRCRKHFEEGMKGHV